MGFIKYITIFDDEAQMVLSSSVLDKYKISAYPTVFFADGKPYFSSVNAQSADYMKIVNTCDDYIPPNITEEVFMDAYKTAYEHGYFKVVVICPHAKWYPYYKSALDAANRFKRHRNIDFSTYEIFVIDSKSFAIGPMLQMLDLAHKHELYFYPSDLSVALAKKAPNESRTFIMTKSGNVFGKTDNELAAYHIYGNNLKTIALPDSHEHIKFDEFVKAVAYYVRKENKRFAVSIGCNCDFAANIIGRINKITGKSPISCMMYGITSAAVIGDNTICVNVL